MLIEITELLWTFVSMEWMYIGDRGGRALVEVFICIMDVYRYLIGMAELLWKYAEVICIFMIFAIPKVPLYSSSSSSSHHANRRPPESQVLHEQPVIFLLAI